MTIQHIFHFLKRHWGFSLLLGILLVIVVVNIRPGFLVLGNDNFSPELDPALSLERSVMGPGWRTYRVLGIPSDSEQADLFRTVVFFVLKPFLPGWILSQGYLFLTFVIASVSMGALVALLTRRLFGEKQQNLAFLFGGLFYTCSMLTSWVYFFPVHLFVAAYAFLPFVLWRLATLLQKPSVKNSALLFLASLFLATSALTATMFIVEAMVIVLFLGVFLLLQLHHEKRRSSIAVVAWGLVLIFGIQAFWALPFLTYVQSNTKALQDSTINRNITTTTIENEARYNTPWNVPRYYSSWMDTKEDKSNYTFPNRDWYVNSPVGVGLSFVPVVLALIGSFYLFRRKHTRFWAFPIIAIIGWYLIKGINPPLGFIYSFIQDNFPVVAQVFRWQSSKLWPFLATTMPFLATIGVLYLAGSLQHLRGAFTKHSSKLLYGVVIVSLLVFVFPYFSGGLIRQRMFVKVPEEYTELAKYLRENDRFSRIYLAPEANTLYFRNYDFGFWGSVLLNYIVPNPIIEKALIIGSYENEQAFTVMTNAYYSENPQIFADALKRYNTPYILSDEHAATGEIGYAYNWDVHAKVVEDNPNLEKVWESGKLALYKVKNDEPPKPALSMSSQMDPTRLNTLLASLHDTTPYYTSNTTVGMLYPFAMQYDKLLFSPTEIVAKTTYTGKNATFQHLVTKADFDTAPVQVNYDLTTKQLAFSPVLPYIGINDALYTYQIPVKRFTLKDSAAFISVGDAVIDERTPETYKAVNAAYDTIATSSAAVRAWSSASEPLDLLSVSNSKSVFTCSDDPKVTSVTVWQGKRLQCKSPKVVLSKDAIIEANVTVKSNTSVHMLLCVESAIHSSCVNKNTSAFVDGVGEFTMLIPHVFRASDTVQVYLDFQMLAPRDARVSITTADLKLHTDNETPTLIDELPAPEEQVFTVPVKTNDTFSLHVPILEGANSSPLRSDGKLIPESSILPFEAGKPFKSAISISPKNGLEIINTESNSSVFPKLSFLDPRGGVAFMAVSATHTSGIPAEISVRDTKEPYKIWSRKLATKQQTQALDIFMMPDKVRSYYIDIFATGFGPRSSKNNIQALVFQVIPPSWYGMRLLPTTTTMYPMSSLTEAGGRDTNTYTGQLLGRGERIVTIPTANSSHWNLIMDGRKESDAVVVNGWQQAWKITEGGKAVVTFFPNLLAYVGYLPLVGVIGWLFVHLLRYALCYKAKQEVAHHEQTAAEVDPSPFEERQV